MPKRKELTERERRHKKLALILTLICGCLIFLHFIIISIFFTWSDWVSTLIFSLLFIVPAYLANACMVFAGGGKPIDGGKTWRGGSRILGDHKTWNGIIKGPFYGIIIAIGIFTLFLVLWQFIGPAFQAAIDADLYILYANLNIYEYYFVGGIFPIGFVALIIRIALCAYGAGIGDLVGSFLKRRFNVESGGFVPLIDQLDFVIFAIFFTLIPIIFAPTIFWVPDINIVIFLMILTPSVSIIGNNVGYYTGIKEVPW